MQTAVGERAFDKGASRVWALCGLLAFMGCSGSIEAPAGEGSSAGGGGTKGSSGKPGESGAPSPEVTFGGPEDVAGPMPLRRLTREEYDNVVADVLGDASRPSSLLAAEGRLPSGQVRQGAVSGVEASAYRDAAEATATRVVARGPSFTVCPGDGASCAKAFFDTTGRRLFRRPLDAAEAEAYGKLYSKLRTAPFDHDHKNAMRVVLTAMLQSPQFLYRWELGPQSAKRQGKVVPLTPFELASRLSFFLWRSAPDDELLAAAADGKLKTTADIERQVERMLADAKAARAPAAFVRQILDAHLLEGITKNPQRFPTFDVAMAEALAAETDAFAQDIFKNDGRFESLLLAPRAFVNSKLAGLYGLSGVSGDGVRSVNLANDTQRFGLLTQGTFLAVHATAELTSPVLRGKTLLTRFLCEHIEPPPADAESRLPPPKPGEQTRERFEALEKDPVCGGCHRVMDPLGFAFERYDAAGVLRDMEAGRPVRTDGVATLDGRDVSFKDARELVGAIAKSDQVRQCMTRQWLAFALGRPEATDDGHSLEVAHEAFSEADYDLRALARALTTTMSFRHRMPAAGEELLP